MDFVAVDSTPRQRRPPCKSGPKANPDVNFNGTRRTYDTLAGTTDPEATLAQDKLYPMTQRQSSMSKSSGTMLVLAVAGVTGNIAETALVNPPLFVAVKEQL